MFSMGCRLPDGLSLLNKSTHPLKGILSHCVLAHHLLGELVGLSPIDDTPKSDPNPKEKSSSTSKKRSLS